MNELLDRIEIQNIQFTVTYNHESVAKFAIQVELKDKSLAQDVCRNHSSHHEIRVDDSNKDSWIIRILSESEDTS